MKAFITGITGFAGPYLAEHLLACGDEVLGCSLNGRWSEDVGEQVTHRVPLFATDITQDFLPDVVRLVEDFQPDIIFHMAAMSVPADCGSTEPTPQALAVNVAGTRNVLELAARLPQRPKIFFTSSAHVYAPVTADHPFVDEHAPAQPTSGYGKTKLAAEALIAEFAAQNKIETVIARVFKHAGPRQSTRLMLAQWAQQLVRPSTSQIEVYSLNSFFDLTDVRDMTRGFRTLATKAAAGDIINIGSGINHRSGDMLERMRQLAGSSIPVVETRPAFHQEPIARTEKLVTLTNWRPEFSLEQTLRDTLDYWRKVEGKSPPT